MIAILAIAVVEEVRQANVRFTPESGHRAAMRKCLLCAKSGHSASTMNATFQAALSHLLLQKRVHQGTSNASARGAKSTSKLMFQLGPLGGARQSPTGLLVGR